MHTDKRSSTCVFKHPLVLFFDWNSCVQLVKIQNLPIHIQTHTYTHHEQYVWAKKSKISHTNILFRENGLPYFESMLHIP